MRQKRLQKAKRLADSDTDSQQVTGSRQRDVTFSFHSTLVQITMPNTGALWSYLSLLWPPSGPPILLGLPCEQLLPFI